MTEERRAADEALLRRFEPILRFTRGEQFFPMPATTYVEGCDLLSGATLATARVVIPAGELHAASLAAAGEPPRGEARFLRYVQRPLNPIELARFNRRPERERFRAPGTMPRTRSDARRPASSIRARSPTRASRPGARNRARSGRLLNRASSMGLSGCWT